MRHYSMKLAADMIGLRRVAGSIAELGVYQGETAALLNSFFPDRPLHLFDTFEGFSNSDLYIEVSRGYSVSDNTDFRNTDLKRVLSLMPHPNRVIVHKGFFPDTARGLEDRFAFVSLDVDLFAPTLAGLEWFYDRLNPGGYIFVHDYHNARFRGVRSAVEAFLERVPAAVLPIPDFAGSLVFAR